MNLRLKGCTDEDFTQYKKPTMFMIWPFCDFKCDRDNGTQLCQNWELAKAPIINTDADELIQRYLANPITKAFSMGGLEPLESFDELYGFIDLLRNKYNCHDDVVIYTGFKEEEIEKQTEAFKNFDNIIIKYGRFKPNQEPHFDEVLGISLVNDEQYAVKIS